MSGEHRRPEPSDDETAARLRDALHHHADAVTTSPDALQRIRARTHRRRRSGVLRNGGLIAATAAAAVAAIVLVPRVLSSHGNEHHTATDGSSEHVMARPSPRPFGSHRPKPAPLTASREPGGTASAPPATARPRTAVTQAPSVSVGQSPKLRAEPLVWPVSDVLLGEKSLKAGRTAGASTATDAAVTFVRTVTGSGGAGVPPKLTAATVSVSPSKTAATVSVRRSIRGTTHEVCLAKAIQISNGTRAFWAIRDVSSGAVRITYAPPLSGSRTVTVAGYADASGGAQNVDVAVGTAGSTDFLGQAYPRPTGAFTSPVPLKSSKRASGVVLVWTVDRAGNVLSFAASPTR